MPISLKNSSGEIEDELSHRMRGVRWVGELDLSREEYDVLGRVIRQLGCVDNRPRVSRIPPVMFITSMVFTARYAEFDENERPAFWRKYAEMVWKLDSADQVFQNNCRERFREVRAKLEEDYDLVFPHRIGGYTQDVVSGIYMHAILPSYLEDDFASWLKDLWRRPDNGWASALNLPLDALVEQLRNHPSLKYVRRRLSQFIENDDTCETAASLVRTMAEAAEEYDAGTDFETIAGMLTSVESAVWRQLHAVLTETRAAGREHRAARSRSTTSSLVPAWALDSGKLAVQVRNLTVNSAARPDRVVWLPRADQKEYKHYVEVNPWRVADSWAIDTVYIDDVAEGGFVSVVDEQDNHLLERPLSVPVLPTADVLFFRLTDDEQYAVLTEPDRVVSAKKYILSSKNSLTVQDDRTGEALQPKQQLKPLTVLQEHGWHTSALYELRLPISVAGIRLRARRDNLNVMLDGDRIPGLKTDLVPVFTHQPQLKLIQAAHLRDKVSTVRLRLIPSNGRSPIEAWLAECPLAMVGDDLQLDLSAVAPGQTGSFSLTLLNNVRHVLPEPLRFVVLPPHIKIEPPPTDGYFTVYSPPQAKIHGVDKGAVSVDSVEQASLFTAEGGAVTVRWRDPFAPARLQVTVDGQPVWLHWDVCWRHACVRVGRHPAPPTLRHDDLHNSTLTLIGKPREAFTLCLDNGLPRTVQLSARGVYETVIANDPLVDMLREHPGGRVTVSASDGRTPWELFTFIKGDGSADSLPSLAQRAVQTARVLSRSRYLPRARIGFELANLAALPPQWLKDFPAQQADQAEIIVRALQEAQSPSTDMLTMLTKIDILPRSWPVELLLRDATEPIRLTTARVVSADSVDQITLRLMPRATGLNHEIECQVTVKRQVTEDGIQVRLFGGDTKLWQCATCGKLFVHSARAMHSHGKGWNAHHHDLSDWTQAQLKVDYQELFANWRPDFGKVLNRDSITSLRINKDAARHCLKKQTAPSFYCRDGYRYAVAAWSLNMEQPEKRNQLESLKDSQAVRVGRELRERLATQRTQPQAPALAFIGFLSEMLEPKDDDTWFNLDLGVFILALICRAAAHNRALPTETALPDNELIALLESALEACPQLTAWAFAWVELAFVVFH